MLCRFYKCVLCTTSAQTGHSTSCSAVLTGAFKYAPRLRTQVTTRYALLFYRCVQICTTSAHAGYRTSCSAYPTENFQMCGHKRCVHTALAKLLWPSIWSTMIIILVDTAQLFWNVALQRYGRLLSHTSYELHIHRSTLNTIASERASIHTPTHI